MLEVLIARGEVLPDEEVVAFNTGAATKYLEALPANLPTLDKNAIDRDALMSSPFAPRTAPKKPSRSERRRYHFFFFAAFFAAGFLAGAVGFLAGAAGFFAAPPLPKIASYPSP